MQPSEPRASIAVRVTAMRLEAPDVMSLELRAEAGHALPEAEPGTHVDLHLPNDVIRPYSVVANEEGAYLLGVKRESQSRGGSAYVHDHMRVGDSLRLTQPRQKFPLADQANHSVLIAGGIGITPLLPMARALHSSGRSWQLHYAGRDIASFPFARVLQGMGEGVHFYASRSASGGPRPDLRTLVDNAPPDSHFYCCGPPGMLEDFKLATRDLDPSRVHTERFHAVVPEPDAGGFELHLSRSGRRIKVHPNQTALDALLAEGVDVDYSCRQGVCGSCEARVLQGTPEHQDEVLTEAERASNRSIILCCSRSREPLLVLDL